ncbi:aspartate/glutamate racemase family protein [Pseudohoeflea coraliihabitans]|uniref:Aspartate/glutamate racemase family protein n=1 Tax=Pseudohoeflea coraliihabitans TaxID=2860393 RepID=A0ABS6WL80_9HYPH|nr:aspartate/glutamate racemase family protein [Pseudohoeflea sp. DP4N28-3]MBW3096709.1 aspartate/glutamate racemase family protein [Pseudohoeflea sp. DP4N28-3]
MKLIGLLGGMSWESTALYYKMINETVKSERGGLHSARILLHSVNFHEIAACQHDGDWAGAGRLLVAAAQSLRAGGADFLVIATNTMHKLALEIETAGNLPLLHIVDPTAEALRADGHRRVALLGTRFTMEEDFYRRRLTDRFGLEVFVPDQTGRETIHRIIYEELCRGTVNPASAELFRDVITTLKASGAQALILGCTELTMIIDSDTSALPLYDTTLLHATRAARFAMET